MKKLYLTTAIPYVNGKPHVGHALDYLLADVFYRYETQNGAVVRFQSGTDEHGNKIAKKAAENNKTPKAYADENSAAFRNFIKDLNVHPTDFIRTTDEKHIELCQKIWQKLSPHIYSSSYDGFYCEGCEAFVTKNEYDKNHGICPDHEKPYTKISEKNYYLRLSDFKSEIKAKIESNEMQILPEFRKKEVLNLLDDAPDVSISRPQKSLTWGIPVPGDDSQVMYVWLDALSNYLTVLGYPDADISEFWPPALQVVGKDILRFHAIIWPAMLLGLGLPLPKILLSHGYILSNSEKMSKSLGNVVDPIEILNLHGSEPFRYFFLRHIDTFLDSDFSREKFESAYSQELANDLGNLVQRLATLCSKNNLSLTSSPETTRPETYCSLMNHFEYKKAFDFAWEQIQDLNKRIDSEKPWTMKDDPKKQSLVLTALAEDLLKATDLLSPFLPDTSAKITEIFTKTPIKAPESPLFPKN